MTIQNTITTLKSVISPVGETVVKNISLLSNLNNGSALVRLCVENIPSQLESSSRDYKPVIVTFDAVATLDDNTLALTPMQSQNDILIKGYAPTLKCIDNAAHEIANNWMPFGTDGHIYDYIQNDTKLVPIYDKIKSLVSQYS